MFIFRQGEGWLSRRRNIVLGKSVVSCLWHCPYICLLIVLLVWVKVWALGLIYVHIFLSGQSCAATIVGLLSLSVLNKRVRSWDSLWIESHSPRYHTSIAGPSGAKEGETRSLCQVHPIPKSDLQQGRRETLQWATATSSSSLQLLQRVPAPSHSRQSPELDRTTLLVRDSHECIVVHIIPSSTMLMLPWYKW